MCLSRVLEPSLLQACASCSLEDDAPSMLEPSTRPPVRVALETRTWKDQLGDLTWNGILLEELRTTLRVSLALSPGWSGTLSLPLLARQVTSVNLARTRVLGPGDLELQLTGRLWQWEQASLSQGLLLQTGLILPSAPLILDATGLPLPSECQPGAGAWSPSLGLAYRLGWTPFSALLMASSTLPGPGYLEERRGASLNVSAMGSWTPLKSLGLGLGLNFRADQPTLEGGQSDPDSGGTILFAALESQLRPTSRIELRVGLALPVVNHLTGTHLEAPTASAGVAYAF